MAETIDAEFVSATIKGGTAKLTFAMDMRQPRAMRVLKMTDDLVQLTVDNNQQAIDFDVDPMTGEVIE